jgi:hypothetical protein
MLDWMNAYCLRRAAMIHSVRDLIAHDTLRAQFNRAKDSLPEYRGFPDAGFVNDPLRSTDKNGMYRYHFSVKDGGEQAKRTSENIARNYL